MITTLFMDVDDTLLDFNACAEESMRRAAALCGLTVDERWFPAFCRINDGLWAQIERREMTQTELFSIRWQRIFDALSVVQDGPAFERLFLCCIDESAVPVTGALETLRYLSGQYSVYVTSNGPQAQQEGRLRRAGMLPLVQQVFTSERMGCAKPSTAFFDGCLAACGTRRQEVMVIGDSLSSDMRGAIDSGLHTCLFNIHRRAVPPDMTLDYVVDALADLQRIL